MSTISKPKEHPSSIAIPSVSLDVIKNIVVNA